MNNKEEETMERYNKRLIKILRFFLENEKWITGASIAQGQSGMTSKS